jgi:adenosylhomocysteine nucleosidase
VPILVVAALAEEVAHVAPGVDVLLTGVGKVAAAAALASRLSTGPRPELVVNVGTAGALTDGFAGVHEVGVVTQHDFPYDAVVALVGDAGPRAFRLHPHAPPEPLGTAGGPGDGTVVLGTGDAFVSDAAAAAELAARGLHLVDMEAYAVASTCAAFGVPMRCVKAVSDRADAEAADSWLDLVETCARGLGAWVGSLPH